jgi:hypothetical protein
MCILKYTTVQVRDSKCSGQWNLQPDRDVALIQMGGSQETLAGIASRAIDGGMLSSSLHLQAAKLIGRREAGVFDQRSASSLLTL